MAERFVYLNGDYVPERDAKVSVLDRGFRWSDAVYDATRTFDGRLRLAANCSVETAAPALAAARSTSMTSSAPARPNGDSSLRSSST